MSDTDDIYCDYILNGKINVEKVADTENVLAFHHTRPFYPCHIVIIPKQHIPSLLSLTADENELLAEIFSVVRMVAADVLKNFGAARVLTNLGEYQESKHLHFHVYSGDPLPTN